MKRVVSPAPMEKLFQLMMAPLLLVTLSTLPLWAKVAEPLTTVGANGSADTVAAKQADIAVAMAEGNPRGIRRDRVQGGSRGLRAMADSNF